MKIGEVVECAQHPNADKLRVTKVNVGGDRLLDIVCGAPNCRSFADDVVRGYAKKEDCVVIMRRKMDKIKSALE